MKRPSCKWKGQTDACEESTGGAGSPISRMPQRTKGGLCPAGQTKSPARHPKRPTRQPQNTKPPTAIEYWKSELASKEETTKNLYQKHLNNFLAYLNKTADELIVQRQQDLLNSDRRIQRSIENKLLNYIATKKNEGYAPATLQLIFASIRSFFDTHYFPLTFRRGDYPKGDSNGVKRATKDAILKVLNNDTRNYATLRPAMLFLKDSGLRVSDARLLNCDFFLKALTENPNTEYISMQVITQKTKLLAKTFIGKEAIDSIKQYLDVRGKGTRRVPPETITPRSPLFKVWKGNQTRRISRHSFSTLIAHAFTSIGETRMSAHSLRKKLQTELEKANVNPNWIDQILGHKLINSRDAYSLPTDEELQESYARAYQYIKVYQDNPTTQPVTENTTSQLPTQTATIQYTYTTTY